MNTNLKILFTTLVVIIGILAGASGYLYAKVVTLTKNSSPQPVKEQVVVDTVEEEEVQSEEQEEVADDTSTVQTSDTKVEASDPSSRPSEPQDTHKIASGETLSTIAAEYGLNWSDLANANGLENSDTIKAGQVLMVPKNNQLSFKVNEANVSKLQKEASSGKNAYRFSPIDTAKADISPSYGLSPDDVFTKTKSDGKSATVKVTSGGKSYEITLTQPGTTGDKGIWAIETVKPIK